jgi:ABC-2 type transport system permease protein
MKVVSRTFLAICQRDLLVGWRELVPFLIQVLLQPFFFLFVFGKVLPLIGASQSGYATYLLPGMVAMTTMLAAVQGLMMPLVVDLGHSREIEDRLLAPLSIKLVALEKVLFAAIRGVIAGATIFPLAAWMLGNTYQVRGDALGMIIGLMFLTSLASAALGLTIGSLIQPVQIGFIISVVFLPVIFTGCTFYPWIALTRIPWFLMLTLLNPLTYASEGLRSAMVPPLHGHLLPTLPMGVVLLGLILTTVIFLGLGLRMFTRRVTG